MKSDQDYGQTKQQRLAFALLLAAIDHASNAVDHTLVKAERLPSNVYAGWDKLENGLWRLEVTIDAPRGENAAEKFWQYGIEVYKKLTGISELDIDKPERISDLWKLLSKGDRPIAQNLRAPEEKGPGKWGHHFAFINLPSQDRQECIATLCDWFNNQLSRNPSHQSSNNLPRSGITHFVGRSTKLKEFDEFLFSNVSGTIVAVTGMGGVGKTEFILQYARNYTEKFPGGICWIKVQQESVTTQIISFARPLLATPIPDNVTEEFAQLMHCWRYWSPGQKILLIFDDVNTDTLLNKVREALPPENGRFFTVFTTRHQFGSPISIFPLDVLDEQSSFTQLVSITTPERLRSEDEQAKDLCKFMGYLPFGVELAARFLVRHPGKSIVSLLERLLERRVEWSVMQDSSLEGSTEYMTSEHISAAAMFDITWDELDPETKDLAKRLSIFNYDAVPWSIVVNMTRRMSELFPSMESFSMEALEESLSELIRTSFIKYFDDSTYKYHPLLKDFLRCKLTPEEKEIYVEFFT